MDEVKLQRTARLSALAAGLTVIFFCLGYFGGPQLSSSSVSSSSSVESKTSSFRASSDGIKRASDSKFSERVYQAETEAGISVYTYNSYTVDNPLYGYPWTHMAEPYRTTYLEVSSPVDGATYKWLVDDHVQDIGSSIELVFTSTGSHDVVVYEMVDGESVRMKTFSIMVKYVRREIRSLTDRDREAFFTAVMTLQRVPTLVGQDLYGDYYHSKDFLNRIHLYYGGTADCDHWHQGAGFVTSHIAFTLMFEQSLQSVIPSIALPYWDFTLESTFYDAGSWRSSAVFSSDWFGEAAPTNEMKTVSTGRWAFVPAMTDATNFSSVTNSYGVLRSPWNNDPTPFMTRSSTVYDYENNMKPSGCSEYYRALQKTSWMTLSKQLNSAAHGHLHELMGGSWNHYYAEYELNAMHPAVMTFAHEIQALSKNLWRTNYIVCPDSCDMSTASSDCKCQCNATTIGLEKSYDILDKADILSQVEYFDSAGHLISSWYNDSGAINYQLTGYSEDESQHIYDSLLYLLCDPGHIGSMYQATSTNDITFWVLHPTLDRLWHWKRLGHDANFDETWDPYHTCYGHNPEDLQPFYGMFSDSDDYDDDDGSTARFYSNMQLYNLLHPENEENPYAYDNLEWPHCETIGYDMSNVV